MSTAIEETPQATDVTTNKWVYHFDEGSGENKSLLGGKGAGLCSARRKLQYRRKRRRWTWDIGLWTCIMPSSPKLFRFD